MGIAEGGGERLKMAGVSIAAAAVRGNDFLEAYDVSIDPSEDTFGRLMTQGAWSLDAA